jgi:DNA-binding transcriptional LysR family regulator
MELNWLEDFLALAEHRNFSRAAEARNVTQPAFSRRIRALENWVGTALVLRSPQGVALNAAGEYLRDQAGGLVRNLHQMRRGTLAAAGREGAALCIAATHALSFTFFPGWIRSIFPLEELGTLNLVSDSMAACERILLAGDADFLLCHAHAAAPPPFPPEAFASVVVGIDRLGPVSVPGPGGAPQWVLPGRPEAPVRLLAYSPPSGLGRILEAAQRGFDDMLALDTVFTSPLAAALQTMARQGQGVAWLPQTLADADLATGRLADAGQGAFSVPLEIRLFRPLRRQSAIAEAFWRTMSDAAAAASTG